MSRILLFVFLSFFAKTVYASDSIPYNNIYSTYFTSSKTEANNETPNLNHSNNGIKCVYIDTKNCYQDLAFVYTNAISFSNEYIFALSDKHPFHFSGVSPPLSNSLA